MSEWQKRVKEILMNYRDELNELTVSINKANKSIESFAHRIKELEQIVVLLSHQFTIQ